MLNRLIPFLARGSRPAKEARHDDFLAAYAAWQGALTAYASRAECATGGKSISLDKTLREREEIDRLHDAWTEACKTFAARNGR